MKTKRKSVDEKWPRWMKVLYKITTRLKKKPKEKNQAYCK
jgi:hypothetical protein